MAFGPMIFGFKGKYYFLSNFYPCQVTFHGITYYNSEAAFHAQKDPSRAEEFCKLNASQAKRLGRKVKLRSDWEHVKDSIMKDILICKFKQNPELAQKLINTGDVMLVEANNWGDTYWGYDEVNNVGQNRLGYILMEVRELLLNDLRMIPTTTIRLSDTKAVHRPITKIFKLTYRLLFKDDYFIAYVESNDPAEVEGRFQARNNIEGMYPIDVVSIEEVKPSEVDRSKEYVVYSIYYTQARRIAEKIINRGYLYDDKQTKDEEQ